MKTTIHKNGAVSQRGEISCVAHCYLLFVILFCLAGCPVEPDTESGISISLLINVLEDESGLEPYRLNHRRFFSLASGEEVTDPAVIQSNAWDIGFESHDASFFVLTNSGVTAAELGSGGAGAVWYTEQTDFAAALRDDAVTAPPEEYLPYIGDVTRYAKIMGANPVRETMNLMTYLGYRAGTGTETDPFLAEEVGSGGMSASYSPYKFNKKACYTLGKGMPPTCTPTGRVYVIRHGDGQTLSKLQVAEVYLEYNSAKPREAAYVIRFVHERL
jgi:hypothetical protein